MTDSVGSFELVRPGFERGAIRHALFDFDGTLSLIREGWQDVMVPLMVEVLVGSASGAANRERIEREVREYVDRTTGIQTIYQMMGLADMVRERGGEPLAPEAYKKQYLDRLWERIKDRVAGLKEGRIAPDDLMVPGARRALEALNARAVCCYLASGTDVEYVRDESAALGLAGCFCQIHGAVPDLGAYSKAMVIEAILRDNQLQGCQLVTFGDGYVEIEETVAVGGIAIGVASDEVGRSGRPDPWKRDRLIAAGAHVIIPDFHAVDALLGWLFAA